MLILILMTFSLTGCSNTYFITTNPVDDAGNLEVAIQDQHTEIIDLKLSKLISEINITLNTSIDDVYINISSSVPPQSGNLICLKENTSFYQSKILSVASLGGDEYQVLLDTPLDFAFSTNGGCSIRNDNWAVDGSVTPQIFTVSPAGLNSNWDITRMILVCRGEGVGVSNEIPDSSSFFTMAPITNGIVFRSVNGITKNIFNVKNNFNLEGETLDLNIFDANRLGDYMVSVRRTFNGQDKNGVTLRLNSVTEDRFELIINDDLTDMEECHAYVQGHVVEE